MIILFEKKWPNFSIQIEKQHLASFTRCGSMMANRSAAQAIVFITRYQTTAGNDK
jgi:hypothetical protein